MKKKISATSQLTGALFLSALVFMASCDKDDDAPGVTPNTVVNVAITNGFTTLVGAIGTAGLTATLNGTGPFTVLRQPMLHFLLFPFPLMRQR